MKLIKKRILLGATGLLAAGMLDCTAQVQLSQYTVSPMGSNNLSGGYHLQATFAEMCAVSTLQSGMYILTQGFQQSGHLDVSVYKNPMANLEIVLFPNPTQGSFNIRLSEALDAGYAMIYDVTGRVVHTCILNGVNTSADVSHLPAGGYYLSILDRQGLVMNEFRTTPFLIQQ